MKLVRKKGRQPMILTDTPGKAFDKVALDIVRPFKTTARGNTYVLTMQDLLTKFPYTPLCQTPELKQRRMHSLAILFFDSDAREAY